MGGYGPGGAPLPGFSSLLTYYSPIFTTSNIHHRNASTLAMHDTRECANYPIKKRCFTQAKLAYLGEPHH